MASPTDPIKPQRLHFIPLVSLDLASSVTCIRKHIHTASLETEQQIKEHRCFPYFNTFQLSTVNQLEIYPIVQSYECCLANKSHCFQWVLLPGKYARHWSITFGSRVTFLPRSKYKEFCFLLKPCNIFHSIQCILHYCRRRHHHLSDKPKNPDNIGDIQRSTKAPTTGFLLPLQLPENVLLRTGDPPR